MLFRALSFARCTPRDGAHVARGRTQKGACSARFWLSRAARRNRGDCLLSAALPVGCGRWHAYVLRPRRAWWCMLWCSPPKRSPAMILGTSSILFDESTTVVIPAAVAICMEAISCAEPATLCGASAVVRTHKCALGGAARVRQATEPTQRQFGHDCALRAARSNTRRPSSATCTGCTPAREYPPVGKLYGPLTTAVCHMPRRTLAAVSFVAIPPVPSDDPAPDDVDTCQCNVQHATCNACSRATRQRGVAHRAT